MQHASLKFSIKVSNTLRLSCAISESKDISKKEEVGKLKNRRQSRTTRYFKLEDVMYCFDKCTQLLKRRLTTTYCTSNCSQFLNFDSVFAKSLQIFFEMCILNIFLSNMFTAYCMIRKFKNANFVGE